MPVCMCGRGRLSLLRASGTALYVSSYYPMCPHLYVIILLCVLTLPCVLILLYVSAYYDICAQALSAARKRRVAASLYVS